MITETNKNEPCYVLTNLRDAIEHKRQLEANQVDTQTAIAAISMFSGLHERCDMRAKVELTPVAKKLKNILAEDPYDPEKHDVKPRLPEGFEPYDGSGQPVPDDYGVLIICRDGVVRDHLKNAAERFWQWVEIETDIIGYKVVHISRLDESFAKNKKGFYAQTADLSGFTYIDDRNSVSHKKYFLKRRLCYASLKYVEDAIRWGLA